MEYTAGIPTRTDRLSRLFDLAKNYLDLTSVACDLFPDGVWGKGSHHVFGNSARARWIRPGWQPRR